MDWAGVMARAQEGKIAAIGKRGGCRQLPRNRHYTKIAGKVMEIYENRGRGPFKYGFPDRLNG
jgi:hypothetical protein